MKHRIDTPQDLRKLPVEALPDVAADVRKTIIETISKTGGHLGSGLGAVEIATALHYVYDTPKDKLVWDTGHQAYPHKILTGRRDRFDTIRQYNGLSGFLKRSESEYDAFGAGHASTAISAALGMAAGRDRNGTDERVVAIVSDGCMTGGMCYEAMQNAGALKSDLLVLLNDNQMFISNRVGALGHMLTRFLTLGTVRNLGSKFEKAMRFFKWWGKVMVRIAKRTKVLFIPGMIYEELGFAYFGPVDGHDVIGLVRALEYVKRIPGPVMLHVVTKKGKGLPYAEQEPIKWHGPGAFDVSTGKVEPATGKKPPKYQGVFGKALVREARRDPKVVGITAAMPEGTSLDLLRDALPEQYHDVGLAEEHAVTFAAGLACEGLKPVVAIYSTFLQRGFDQIIHDVCLQKLPVVFAMDRGGLVGADGPTHHGVFDLSYFRFMPNMTVMAPADENELQHMLHTALMHSGPVAFRYPRGEGEGVPMDAEPLQLPIGKGVLLKKGADVTLCAIGNRVHPALAAARALDEIGVSAGLINMRFVKPLDDGLLYEQAKVTGRVVTIEDNSVIGGLSGAVLEALAAKGAPKAEVLRLGVPDRFVDHGSPEELYAEVGLTPGKIAESVRRWMQGDAVAAEAERARA